jgi:hypothetical protein
MEHQKLWIHWRRITTHVPEPEHWVMHFDGSNLLHGLGARVTLKSPKGDELNYVLHIHQQDHGV